MESVAPYNQDSQNNKQQPTTSQSNLFPNQSTSDQSKEFCKQQNRFRVKCGLLEYHIQEALLVNKALKSEIKQYRDKIEFEKKLRKYLVDRVKAVEQP